MITKPKKSDKCAINVKRKNQNIYITFDQNDAFVEPVLCHTYPVNALVRLLRRQTASTMLSMYTYTHTYLDAQHMNQQKMLAKWICLQFVQVLANASNFNRIFVFCGFCLADTQNER